MTWSTIISRIPGILVIQLSSDFAGSEKSVGNKTFLNIVHSSGTAMRSGSNHREREMSVFKSIHTAHII
jgi:hypothetical protein